jgi:hypothetical protein
MKSIVVLAIIVALIGLTLAVETKSNVSTTVKPVLELANSTLPLNVTDGKSKFITKVSYQI